MSKWTSSIHQYWQLDIQILIAVEVEGLRLKRSGDVWSSCQAIKFSREVEIFWLKYITNPSAWLPSQHQTTWQCHKVRCNHNSKVYDWNKNIYKIITWHRMTFLRSNLKYDLTLSSEEDQLFTLQMRKIRHQNLHHDLTAIIILIVITETPRSKALNVKVFKLQDFKNVFWFRIV